MKVTLAQTGVGPFVQQTARALFEAGLLANLWTTFVDSPEAHWRRSLVRIASAVGVDIGRELNRRAVKEVPLSVVRTTPYWEIVRTILARMRVDPRLLDIVWERQNLSFDRYVAKRGLENVDAIYAYDLSALVSFKEAQRRGLARIYEAPSPAHGFIQNLIQQEVEKFPELDDGTQKYFMARQAQRSEKQKQEWELADIVIVNSIFTRDSYAAVGMDVKKARVIPLGAPAVCEESIEGGNDEHTPLRVIWAGTFSIRKGAHYLLSAWKKVSNRNALTLDVYGAMLLPARLLCELPNSIRFRSTIPHGELFQQYESADVLVFPTLCDGFGMVITEAFAHGLPVITTNQAGAADIVVNRKNGLIIPAGDALALAEALEWCVRNRSELRAMRRAALDTAKFWQWSHYRQALARHVREGLKEIGYSS